MSTDDATTVRALLEAAEIEPTPEEVEKMIAAYPGLRAAADSLYIEEAMRFLPAFFPTDAELDAK